MLAEKMVPLCAVVGLVLLLPAIVLGEITENASARVELTPAEVDEGGGSITACAVYSGLEAPTELFMSTIGFTSANPAEKYGIVDFETVSVIVTVSDAEGRVCFNVSIFEDTLIENTEVFSVLVNLNDSYADIQNVAIFDNDGSFEFEQAHYTVSEGAGSITVCAILNIPPRVREEMTLETDLKLFALNGTRDLLAASIAIAGQDYTRVSDTFTASSFTSRRCIDIPILDDNDQEPNERFAVILRVARTLETRDFQAVASVEIEDDDRGPLSISFIGDTPRVVGSVVTVEISLSRRTRSATCILGDAEVEDCFTGTVFRGVPPGKHTIRIEAMNNRLDRATATRKIEIGSEFGFCSTHLINDGVTVDGSTVTVEFDSVGLALSFSCQLDAQPSFSCTSPVVFEDVDAGLHRLRITAGGRFLCSTMRRQLIKFIVPHQ